MDKSTGPILLALKMELLALFIVTSSSVGGFWGKEWNILSDITLTSAPVSTTALTAILLMVRGNKSIDDDFSWLTLNSVYMGSIKSTVMPVFIGR